MLKRVVPILSIMILLLCSCFDEQGKGRNVLRIGYHPNFGGSSAVAIALEKGFFEQEGLDVELVMYQSGPASIGGLMAGDVDVSFLGHGALGLVIESDNVIFALDSLSFAEEIIASRESRIRSLEDLEGKRVAVPFSTSSENFLLSVLDYQHIDSDDIDLVNMDVAGCVSALSGGWVDAVSVWAPYNTEIRLAMGEDAVSIADCMEYKGQLDFPMYWIASRDLALKDHDTLSSFTRALLKALDWRKEHLDETVSIVGDFLGRSQDELLLDIKTADWFDSDDIRRLIAEDEISAMFQGLIEALERRDGSHFSSADISAWLDLSLLEEALGMKE